MVLDTVQYVAQEKIKFWSLLRDVYPGSASKNIRILTQKIVS